MDEMQYRADVNVPRIVKEEVSAADQQNYSTLRNIHDSFASALEELHANFNAFTILDGSPTVEKAEELIIDIKARQKAYDLMIPLYQELQQSLMTIDNDFKRKMEQRK